MVEVWEGWAGGREFLKLDSGGSFHVADIVGQIISKGGIYILNSHQSQEPVLQVKDA